MNRSRGRDLDRARVLPTLNLIHGFGGGEQTTKAGIFTAFTTETNSSRHPAFPAPRPETLAKCRPSGSIVMVTVLTIFACVVAYISGAVTANVNFGLNYYTFVDVGMVGWFDVAIGLVKSVAYGIAIPITACQAGLSVFGGSAGVGRATTRAVVNSSLAVVILDFLISGLGLFVLALI
jgi:hypothetical protein